MNTRTYREEAAITPASKPADPVAGASDRQRATRRRENTRERLLEAAFEVFVEKGLKRVTVDDLVGAAGYTRGAFYSNFTSIDEVFSEVFQRRAAQMLEAARAAIAQVPEEEFTLASIGDVLDSVRRYGRNWYVLQAEFTLLALRDEQARTVLAEQSRRFRAELVEVIDDVLRRLGRRPLVSTEQLAEMVVALHLHSLGQHHLGESTLGEDGLGEEVVSSLILGFSRET